MKELPVAANVGDKITTKLVGGKTYLMKDGDQVGGADKTLLQFDVPLRYRWHNGSVRAEDEHQGLAEIYRLNGRTLLQLENGTFIGLDSVLPDQIARVIARR